MNWQHSGVNTIPAGNLEPNTHRDHDMTRVAAVTHARTQASNLRAGTLAVQLGGKTAPHYHGEFETVLDIVR
jgi:uncharacterized RmlC-like cupin family protein